jgi:hypothetical protein
MDMKMEDRRATPRFLVQFRTTVSGPTEPEETQASYSISQGAGADWKARSSCCQASR